MTIGTVCCLLFFVSCCWFKASQTATSVDSDVTCSSSTMQVTLTLNSSNTSVYLQNLKDYPDCKPRNEDGKIVFVLPLDNIYLCGMFKMENKITGDRIYYHRIMVDPHEEDGKEVVLVTCFVSGHRRHKLLYQMDNRIKRNALTERTTDPEFFNITDMDEHVPIPYLNLAVRQLGRVIDTSLNVQPGTPLEMVIYLDKRSAPFYGLLTSYMKITGSKSKHEEVIIMNGCSIDPYIFGHFETQDNGDSLVSKFRAFKFPESDYVLFVGTVNICLHQCKGVSCGNGQLGYGRRKRDIPPELPPDPNRIFEVEMTAFVKVEPEKKDNDQNKDTAGERNNSTEINNNDILQLTQAELNQVGSAGSGSHRFFSSSIILRSAILLFLQLQPH